MNWPIRVAAVMTLAFLVRLSAQVEFEVASVKENKDMSAGGTTEMRPSLD